MAVKIKREKRFMTPQEKRLRQMLIDHQVSQAEIAAAEGVDQSAINYRLKSLTPSSMAHFEALIIKLSVRNNTPHKVAI